VVVPVVFESPDVAFDVADGFTETAPLSPVLPESPEVAFDSTAAGPELPVFPVLPESPLVAFVLIMAL
jgi:hypothetical protein